MREVEVRAWDEKKKHLYYGYEIEEGDDELKTFLSYGKVCVYRFPGNNGDPYSLNIEQFTGLRDKNGKEIYEGDIVRVMTDRTPKFEYFGRSKYDLKKIEARAVIVFQHFKWMLDIENKFNSQIIELKGKETDERRLTIRENLEDYDFFQNNEWNLKNNAHAYWCEIEVIGNIHENPELLKATR